MSRARILVVDDDPGIRKGCRNALESENYEVEVAGDGSEALRKLAEGRFDLVITDLEMPVLGGLDLLKAARALYPALPVIMFTAFSTIESAGEALRLGAAGYLTKPFELDNLYDLVRRALRGETPAQKKAPAQVSDEAVLGSLLNLLLELAARGVNVDECHFLILSEDRQRLVTRAAWGRARQARLGDSLPLSLSRPGSEVSLEGPVESDARFKGLERFLPAFSAVVPILEGRAILGLLIAGRRQEPALDEEERSFLELYARYAAVLIGHARTFRELQSTCRKLEEAQTRLIQQAKLSVVGQLVSGLVHDINNPLTSILANADHLKKKVEGSLREDAELIEKGGHAIKAIVTSLMSFVRRQTTPLRSCDPGEVLREAVALIQFQCRTKGIKMDIQAGEGLPKAWMEASHFQQVVLNLLMNAIQAIGRSGRIRIEARVFPGEASPLKRPEVRLMVEDDGPGIPPHLLNRIFEPFFTTKTGGEGTGLGLSRCREIVEGHGGLIRAENREEGGSRFWVHLPAEHALAKETPIGTLHKMRAQAWDPERDR